MLRKLSLPEMEASVFLGSAKIRFWLLNISLTYSLPYHQIERLMVLTRPSRPFTDTCRMTGLVKT